MFVSVADSHPAIIDSFQGSGGNQWFPCSLNLMSHLCFRIFQSHFTVFCTVFQRLAQSLKGLHSLSNACTVFLRLSESFTGSKSLYGSLFESLTDLEFLTNLEFWTDLGVLDGLWSFGRTFGVFYCFRGSLGRCKFVHCNALCDKSCVKG